MYRCKVCHKTFTVKQSYKRHELTHSVGFKCRKCRRVYKWRSALLRHQRIKHMDVKRTERHTCTMCDVEFSSARQLAIHKQCHQPPQIGGETRSAISGNAVVTTIRPVGVDSYDLVNFLASVRPTIESYLVSRVRTAPIKWYVVSQVELTREDQDGDVHNVEPYFRSLTYSLLTEDTFDAHDLNAALQKLVIGLEKYIHESSGWSLRRVIRLDIHTALYKPLDGSNFINLPLTLIKSRTILNVRNEDNKCFLWAVLSHLYCVDEVPENVDHYIPYSDTLNMKGIPYPVSLAKLDRFERQNDDISINVFGFESEEIYPLKVTKHKRRQHHINLLYLQEGDLSHYCLITDLNGFLSRTKTDKRKHYFCSYCLNGFSKKSLLESHEEYCSANGEQKIVLPTKGMDDVLKFKDIQHQLLCPFVLYCDFETVVRDVHTCAPDPNKSSTTVTKHHDVCSYGYKRVCANHRYTKESVIYRAPDAARHFVEALLDEEQEILDILDNIEPLIMSDEDELDFLNATHCSICEKRFEPDDCTKVRDHDHLTGTYRGAAHNNCNLQFRTSFIPVVFHGLRNYDGHIIMQCIGEYESCSRGGIKCIPQNMERYISFSLGRLRFLDSYQFLSSSLECLVENLKANGGLGNFKHFASEFQDEDVAQLLLRKNVYPYTYMNDESRFEETRLPAKEAFYSEVKKSHISDADYEHACTVFNTLAISTIGEYSDVYLKTDVLLLCDIFENFRHVCHRDYTLDPCNFYSAPGLSWAAMLRMTRVELELITDVDDLLFWERGIRGGISRYHIDTRRQTTHI